MILTDYERDIVSNVEEYGWHSTHVLSDGGAPGFSYTVGFWETLCTPELIIFGLGSNLMHQMLWKIFDQLRGGAQIGDGTRWSNILEGFDCISRPVHPTQVRIEHFNSALWYRGLRTGSETVDAFQLFWPGAQHGLFPWESGCDSTVRELQPLLYLPLDEHCA